MIRFSSISGQVRRDEQPFRSPGQCHVKQVEVIYLFLVVLGVVEVGIAGSLHALVLADRYKRKTLLVGHIGHCGFAPQQRGGVTSGCLDHRPIAERDEHILCFKALGFVHGHEADGTCLGRANSVGMQAVVPVCKELLHIGTIAPYVVAHFVLETIQIEDIFAVELTVGAQTDTNDLIQHLREREVLFDSFQRLKIRIGPAITDIGLGDAVSAQDIFQAGDSYTHAARTVQ